jgi:hypothetical protein
MDSNRRIMELHAQGKSHAEIATQLTAEGLQTSQGKEFTANAVKTRISRAKPHASETAEKSDGVGLSDVIEPSDTIGSLGTSDASVLSEVTLPEQHGPMPEHWKAEIMELIRGELDRMQTSQIFQKPESMERLPSPDPAAKIKSDKGRKVNPWERVKVGVTLDKALVDLLEKERDKLGKTATLSHALDTVLWHYFGKPELSFQKQEDKSVTAEPEPADKG